MRVLISMLQNSKSEYFGIRLGIKGLEEEGFSDAYKAIVSRPNSDRNLSRYFGNCCRNHFVGSRSCFAWLGCKW